MRPGWEESLTCTSVPLLHPDVAVGLGHAGLGVQERHEDAALSTEPGVVAVALLHRIFIILLPQPGADGGIEHQVNLKECRAYRCVCVCRHNLNKGSRPWSDMLRVTIL